jgi:hypothetical protein
MKTAAEVDAPSPEAAEPNRGARIRWTQRRRDIFNFIRPVSVSLVATDGPVSITVFRSGGLVPITQIGHNRAVWPAKVVKGSTLRDAATTTHDKFPGVFLGTQARLWCLREADRDRVVHSIVDLIALRAERDGALAPLDKGFSDLGPELDLEFFEMEMHGVAQMLGIQTWDDDGLVRWFDSIGRRFDALQAERPDLSWSKAERIVAKIAQRDLEAVGKEGRG